MADIDTTSPFASVREAICMFGEQPANATQSSFPTTNALQLEKIHTLEVELQNMRQEYANMQNQLQVAQTNATDASKELTETKNVLEETNKKTENILASRISSLESQLGAALEQGTQRSQEIENYKKDMKKISNEYKDLKIQHKHTLKSLSSLYEENDQLRDNMVHESNAIARKHEQNLKEQENKAQEKIKKLLEDLLTTNNMLTKVNVAREKLEKEYEVSKELNVERIKDQIITSTIAIDKMRSELQEVEKKNGEISVVVEKLEDELLTTKEAEMKALQAEIDANLILKKMKIEVEDSKVAKENVRMMAIQLEDMNAKLKIAMEEEESFLTSLKSIKADLKYASKEVQNMKREIEDTSIEIEEQINHLQLDLDATIFREAKTKKCLLNLNEAFQQMTVEAVEAKAAAFQASKEFVIKAQELEESLLHIQTLECRLLVAQKETEAIKASNVFAQTEVKFLKKKDYTSKDDLENGEYIITISHDEYKLMAKKVTDLEDLAQKQQVAAIAQVDAYKASELENSTKLENTKKLLTKCQVAMRKAIEVAEATEVAKFALEEELRKWRLENEQKRKATVAAVMACESSENAILNDSSIVVGDDLVYQKNPIIDESSRSLLNNSPSTLQTKESLAPLLRYNHSKKRKVKKNLLSNRISLYFNKKVG